MKVRSGSLATLLALSMGVALVACGSDDDNPSTPGTGGTVGTGGRGGGSGGSGTGGSVGTGGTGTGGSVSTGGSVGTGGTGTGGASGGTGGGSGGASGGTGGSDAAGETAPGTGGAAGGDAGGETGGAGAFALTVSDVDMRNGKLYFKMGQTRGTGQRSPVFEWTAQPGALSYALSMYDRTNNNNTHWVMYDIPPTVTKLPANLAHMTMSPEVPGAKHTSFAGGIGYFGPGANGCNTYVFEVHAMKAATTPVSGNNNNIRNTILVANRVAKTAEVLVIGNTSAGMCN